MNGTARAFYCLILFLISPFVVCGRSEAFGPEVGNKPLPSACILSVSFENRLLKVETEHAPLDAILYELACKTGSQFELRDPALASDPVSVSFDGLVLSDALERILRNYSYLLEYGRNDEARVIILASKASRGGPSRPAKESLIYKEKTYKTEGSALQAISSEDECEKLWPVATISDRYSGGDSGEADAEANTDDIVSHARELLLMDQCSRLWRQILNQLALMHDRRATELLAEIASKGKPAYLRGEATEALWHNVAKSGFTNTDGISALEKLSWATDETVKAYAERALEDYKNYTERTHSRTKEPSSDTND